MTHESSEYSMAVAIIGMAGRFPGAPNVEQFWHNITGGVRSIRFFSDNELLAAGVSPELLQQPNYVKAGTVIEGAELFDAAFFGYSPREAEVMDPQHRLFLECAWEALEQAAYDPESYTGLIGTFAGSGYPTYMTNNLATHPGLMESIGALQVAVGNERDSLASTVSYKLNLRGPGVSVQTFCSTSLVAVHLAYQSLITYECDMALAGGVAISFPQISGYFYQEGGIVSPDGSCRTFDAQAKGSVMGNGVGVVVLKRLEEALNDGDQIYAIIRGSAVNNDGLRKVGYTAPGLSGQAAVMMSAHLSADVEPESIGYIEAHGTATPLGDSVELAAMIQAFTKNSRQKRFCAIGSVKPNIGHLDRASGVTGLIKTAMALTHKKLPPHLNFERSSPDIDLENSPFYVNTELRDWPEGATPRRAGVSSFGLGGTNAHVVLEEAPARAPSSAGRPYHLLVLSAKTETALEAMTANLVAHCRANPDLNPADLAYTLQVGRAAFNHRRMLVFRDLQDAISALEQGESRRVQTMNQIYRNRPVAFLFPGVGDHYVGMARDLYLHEAGFRAVVDESCKLLEPLLGQDLRTIIYPDAAPSPEPTLTEKPNLRALLGRSATPAPAQATLLRQTMFAQPAVFVIEYALARLLMDWGLKPQAMIGYSLGEYVAACVSGVLSLEDALRLVAMRAKLIQALPAGAMLAVGLNEYEVRPYLDDEVSLAAINSPSACVLAGPPEAIAAISERLQADGVVCRPVETTHAFHTAMLAPAAEALIELASSLTLNPPQIPYLSNVTGTWITPEQATDPAYWAQHMCEPVRFADGVTALLKQTRQVLLELGPGQALGSFVRQHPACNRERASLVLSTLRAAHETRSDVAGLLQTLGQLWLLDVALNWNGLYSNERRYRVPLPTYPFERQRYWIEPGEFQFYTGQSRPAALRRADSADWFYVPEWVATPLAASPTAPQTVMLLGDEQGFGARLAQQLEQAGHRVIRVWRDTRFARRSSRLFTVRPTAREDYTALLEALDLHGLLPQAIVHCWNLVAANDFSPDVAGFRAALEPGFGSLLALVQALGERDFEAKLPLLVLSNGVQLVNGDEQLATELAPIIGLSKVITQEYELLTCRSIDLLLPPPGSLDERSLIEQLNQELFSRSRDLEVAYRNGNRLTRSFRPERLEAPPNGIPSRLRQGGVYLITGGLGGIGPYLAGYLARSVQAKIVLLGRSTLPDRATWPSYTGNDPVAQRIKKIQELEAAGAEVLLLQADVADEAQMRTAIERTIAHFGALHGIIYAAGSSDDRAFGLLQELSLESFALHFPPKVYGLYTLERVTEELDLDFCVLFSSLSSVLGGLSFAGYVAANAFIDLFTQRHNQRGRNRWMCVNWDTWRVKENAHGPLGASIAQYEMSPEEGIAAFNRVLDYAGTWLVNSTGDITVRIRQWILLESRQEQPGAGSALTTHARPALETPYVPPSGDYEQRIAAIWQQVLGVEQIGLHDNFFDLGGNSLNGLQVIAKLKKEFKVQLPAVALFEAPTVSTLAQYLRPQTSAQVRQQETILRQRRERARQGSGVQDIAIVGMVGRFPGAATIEQFWHNLCAGVESIARFSEEELLAAGVDPQQLRDPNYVRARPVLDDVELFDPAFFGYTPREAELMDPQQRLFHECAWEALEVAGYDAQRYKGLIGVFAGSNLSTYLLNLARDPEIVMTIREITILENDKDALATNVAYRLNLRGPSVAVQTFCSTALVAVHLACRSLLGGECDMALAGGVSVRVPVRAGYLYQEDGLSSPDGHCRSFDANANGSVYGDGVSVVVLKRLADALEDGDTIHAVIKGSAINNDGNLKVGYTAPGIVGQSEVIVSAIECAGIDPTSISYVEAHGTGTRLGDPIEVAALTRAFRTFTEQTQFCAVGSYKPNFGHLDRASGTTGLIKTVMMLKHELIPPLLHFTQPNPEIDFDSSPFYVPTALRPWPRSDVPRRAAVNAQGTGGTNAHVIVEEAPPLPATTPSRPYQVLMLSARTPSALAAATDNLYQFLCAQPDVDLADVAYTLQVGRRIFDQRRMFVCQDREEACRLLRGDEPQRLFTFGQQPSHRQLVFLFSGIDTPYVGVGLELYQQEAIFRAMVDRCARLLQGRLNLDIRAVLYPDLPEQSYRAREDRTPNEVPVLDPQALITRPDIAQAISFVLDYALAHLLLEWGLVPQAMLGYGSGEYVAACLSGVLALEDALNLMMTRAESLQEQAALQVLSVGLSETAVQAYLSVELQLITMTSENSCLIAGPAAALAQTRERLQAAGIACTALTHPLTGRLAESTALSELLQSITLRPPQIPYLSNVTGTWITPEQATDPEYWLQQASQPIRLAEAAQLMLEREEFVLLAIGPSQHLTALMMQHPLCNEDRLSLFFSTLCEEHETQGDLRLFLTTLGKLWLLNIPIDWNGFYANEQRRRIVLPTYPFERQHYWLEPQKQRKLPVQGQPERRHDMSEWFATASWRRANPCEFGQVRESLVTPQVWLIFHDRCGIGAALANWLRAHDQQVIGVSPGTSYARSDAQHFSLRPDQSADYAALFADLADRQQLPDQIVHLWTVTPADELGQATDELDSILAHGFYSLMALAQALGSYELKHCRINIISTGVQEVTGSEELCPAKATLLGPCQVIPQEYEQLSSRSIDIVLPGTNGAFDSAIEQLALELLIPDAPQILALRGPHRWVQSFEPVPIATPLHSPLREGGVYLITGGLGNMGLALAEHLASRVQAKLVLLGRTALPPRQQWDDILATPDSNSTLARRIARIKQLEAHTELLVLQADVTDLAQVQAAVAQTLAHFGAIHGVIHCAGLPGHGLIQHKTAEQAAAVLAPKVQGTLHLAEALRGVNLDFLVLCSSASATLSGGLGQVDYCAANIFLDAYARTYHRAHGRTSAIGWGQWHEDAWQSGLHAFPSELRHHLITMRQTYGISCGEGAAALERVLSRALPHVYVTPQDLSSLLEQSQQLRMHAVLEQVRATVQRRARPLLAEDYQAPRSELERAICTLWERTLGLETVGINDDFFGLGGNSLLGASLIGELRRELRLDHLPASLLAMVPTVSAIAAYLSQTTAIQGDKL